MNKIKVRISDNVLQQKDWTVYELELDDVSTPRVISQRVLNKGVYAVLLLEKTMVDLFYWQKYDPTGEHPENYNEIYDWRKGRYRSFMSVIDIKQIVEGDKRGYDCEKEEGSV